MAAFFGAVRRSVQRQTADPSPPAIRLALAAASLSVAYAILIGVGLIPPTASASAGAFAVLGFALLALAWGDPVWGPLPRPTPSPSPTAVPPRPRPSLPSAPARRPAPIGRPTLRPALPALRTATVARAAAPGDALWARLATPSPGELPVALVGPTREAAFAADLSEAEEAPAAAAFGSGSYAALSHPTWTSMDTGVYGRDLSGPHGSHAEREAFDHRPPHLRGDRSRLNEVRGPHLPIPRPEPPTGAHCATCRRSLSNPPAWRSCTSCHRPFCGDCSFRARRSLGAGRCLDCAGRLEVEEPRFVA
ncbi:MAG: hypothetical protein L3K06_04985 [Thermoplasmata archaeon]|nr:hypothetical protein [Thermoplasmata archaeon]